MISIKTFLNSHKLLSTFMLCFLALMLISFIFKLEFINKINNAIELKSLDWRYQESLVFYKPDTSICLILLDDISKQRSETNKDLNISYSVLPDETSAKLIHFLKKCKAKYIVFNSKFESKEVTPESLNIFLDAVKEAGNVILPFTFSNSDASLVNEQSKNELLTKNIDLVNLWKASLTGLNTEELRTIIKRFKLDIFNDDLFYTFKYFRFLSFNSIANIPENLLESCFSAGARNLIVDEDGIIRRSYPLFNYDKGFYPSLGMAVARSVLDDFNNELEFTNNGNLKIVNRTIPIDDHGTFFLNWLKAEKAYPQYRLASVIESINKIENSEVPDVNPDEFKNKIVIIGNKHSGTTLYTSPVTKGISNSEIQAIIIDNLINSKSFIHRLSPIFNFIIALLLGFFTSILVIKQKSAQSLIIGFAGIITLNIVLALITFNYFYLWIDMIFPLFFIIFVFIVAFLVKYSILAKAYEDTHLLAIKDGLTKLYNHRYFKEVLKKDYEKAKRYNEMLSLLMLDIDNFRDINDKYGYKVGDSLLTKVAEVINDCVRTSDLVARYGGEEMAVILYNAGIEEAKIVANKINTNISEAEFLCNGTVLRNISVSIGLSSLPYHSQSKLNLVETAEEGLLKAKIGGKNQIGIIEPKVIMYN